MPPAGKTGFLRGGTSEGQLVAVSALGVRRDKAALSIGCKSHPANAPAGAAMEVTK
jgi:hypothetical protein